MKNIIIICAVALTLTACTTPQVTETPPGSGHYSTNYIVDPSLQTTLATIGSINEATKPVNPFSGLVDIGLGTAALLAGWFAKRKNDQAAQSSTLLRTVVQGVENSGDTAAKKAIQTHAVNTGVEGALGVAVAKINSGI